MKHELAIWGDPVLREKAEPVEEITEEVRELVQALLDERARLHGLGMAAPQLGVSLRVFVTCVDDHRPDGTVLMGHPLVYINPRLSNPSEESWMMEEGCLSIPGVRVTVERPLAITVTALDLEGNSFTQHLSGLHARVVMHENDHLNGVMIPDRTTRQQRKAVKKELDDLAKKQKRKT